LVDNKDVMDNASITFDKIQYEKIYTELNRIGKKENFAKAFHI